MKIKRKYLMLAKRFAQLAGTATVAASLSAQPAAAGADAAAALALDHNARQGGVDLIGCIASAVRRHAPKQNTDLVQENFIDEDDGRKVTTLTGVARVKGGFYRGAQVSFHPDHTGPGTLAIVYLHAAKPGRLDGPKDAHVRVEYDRANLGGAPVSVRQAGPAAAEPVKKLVREEAYEVGVSIRACVMNPPRINLDYQLPPFTVPDLQYKP